MIDDYKTFFLKDLVPMINELTLSAMKKPASMLTNPERSEFLLYHNAMTAHYNEGLMRLREMLLHELTKEDEENAGST